MIRCIHVSDFHFGITSYGVIDPDQKLNTRTLEGLRLFDFIIEKAIEGADVLFISGDIFETANPINRVRQEFEQRLVYCSNKGLPVVFIPGNHCVPKSDGSIHPFTSDRVYNLPHIYLIDKVEVRSVITKGGESIEVLGLPHLYPKDWKIYGDNSSDAVFNIIKKIDMPKDTASVVLAHPLIAGTINSYTDGNLFTEEFQVAKEVFQSTDKFGAFLLGHIHQHIMYDDRIWTSGSIFPNNFGEEADIKGYVYFEIDNKNKLFNRKFIPFEKYTRFKTVTVFIKSEEKDPTAIILKSINHANIDDCIVRIFFVVSEKQLLQVDMNMLRSSMKNAVSFEITYDVTDNKVDNKYALITDKFKPSEAVEKFCNYKGEEYKTIVKDLKLLTDSLMDEVLADRDVKIKSLE